MTRKNYEFQAVFFALMFLHFDASKVPGNRNWAYEQCITAMQRCKTR